MSEPTPDDLRSEVSDLLDSDEYTEILIECRRLLKEVQASQIETATLVKQFVDGITPALNEVLPKLEAIAESSWFRYITGGKKR